MFLPGSLFCKTNSDTSLGLSLTEEINALLDLEKKRLMDSGYPEGDANQAVKSSFHSNRIAVFRAVQDRLRLVGIDISRRCIKFSSK